MNTNFCGAESAARIVKYLKPDSECGFGVCAGDPDCRDKQCPGHPCQTMTLPVIDTKFLDEESLNARLRNSCLNDWPPIQYADEDQSAGQFLRGVVRSSKLIKNIAIAIGGGLLIAAVIYASTK